MRKIIHFLGIPLALLLGAFWPFVILGLLVSADLMPDFSYYLRKFGTLYGVGFEAAFFASVGLNVAYIAIGIRTYAAGALKRNGANVSNDYAKRMVLRGVVGVIAILLMSYVLYAILGSFYISLSGSLPGY